MSEPGDQTLSSSSELNDYSHDMYYLLKLQKVTFLPALETGYDEKCELRYYLT